MKSANFFNFHFRIPAQQSSPSFFFISSTIFLFYATQNLLLPPLLDRGVGGGRCMMPNDIHPEFRSVGPSPQRYLRVAGGGARGRESPR